jgi:glutamyl-tRNA synthetase
VSVRVRIAPSPTGNLHIGTARTAVFNWLYAHHHQGTFVLRIEDTDAARSRLEYTENIKSGLEWLGLNWDEGPFFQTQRLDKYQQAVQTLLDKGLAYPCYCTPEELDQMRETQKAMGKAPGYDNRHRHLSTEEKQAFEAQGRKPVIRFKIDGDRQIIWQDAIRDSVSWQGSDLGGDMVIARAAENANTAKQILLYEALDAEIPLFAHSPLILNQDGRKLSKRDGVTSIDDFRKMGFLPEALVNYMILLGWTFPDSTKEIFTLEEAAAEFDLDRVNKAGAKFDWDKLDWLNSQYLHAMPTDRLTDLLIPYWQEAGYDIDSKDRSWLESLTSLTAPTLNRLTDVIKETSVFFTDGVEYSDEAMDLLQQEGVAEIVGEIVAGVNSTEAVTAEDAQALIKQVTKSQKVKKGLVMRSLRASLTGELHGPDLTQTWLLLNQLGADKTRLEQTLAKIAG